MSSEPTCIWFMGLCPLNWTQQEHDFHVNRKVCLPCLGLDRCSVGHLVTIEPGDAMESIMSEHV